MKDADTPTRRDHPCAVCKKPIRTGFLMCGQHWRLVPHAEQLAVYRTWGAFSRAPNSPNKVGLLREYRGAADAAVTAAQAAMGPEKS